jgi:hypothetical protein
MNSGILNAWVGLLITRGGARKLLGGKLAIGVIKGHENKISRSGART